MSSTPTNVRYPQIIWITNCQKEQELDNVQNKTFPHSQMDMSEASVLWVTQPRTSTATEYEVVMLSEEKVYLQLSPVQLSAVTISTVLSTPDPLLMITL